MSFTHFVSFVDCIYFPSLNELPSRKQCFNSEEIVSRQSLGIYYAKIETFSWAIPNVMAVFIQNVLRKQTHSENVCRLINTIVKE